MHDRSSNPANILSLPEFVYFYAQSFINCYILSVFLINSISFFAYCLLLSMTPTIAIQICTVCITFLSFILLHTLLFFVYNMLPAFRCTSRCCDYSVRLQRPDWLFVSLIVAAMCEIMTSPIHDINHVWMVVPTMFSKPTSLLFSNETTYSVLLFSFFQ